MPQPTNEKENLQKRKWLNTYARYSSLGFAMIAVILLGVFGGHYIDGYLKWKFPLFTVVLTLLALGYALYYLIKEVTRK